jgi:hypothetical protein
MTIRWPAVMKWVERLGLPSIALLFLGWLVYQGAQAVWTDAALPAIREITATVVRSAGRIESKMDKIEEQHEQLVDLVQRLDANQQITNDILRKIQADAMAAQ